MFRKRRKDYKEVKEKLKHAPNWYVDTTVYNIKTSKKTDPNLRQFHRRFRSAEFEKLFKKLGIRKKDGLIVSGAGFIGKLPRALEKAGYKVAFSDVSKEFVELAKKGKTISKKGNIIPVKKLKGFQMDITEPHIKDINTSAVIAFEPTPLMHDEGNKIVAHNLGSKNGLILITGGTMFKAAAKDVIEEIDSWKMENHYNLQISEEKMSQGMTAFHIKVPKGKKEMYLKDREIYERMKRSASTIEVAKETGLSRKEIEKRYNRFKNIFGLTGARL